MGVVIRRYTATLCCGMAIFHVFPKVENTFLNISLHPSERFPGLK